MASADDYCETRHIEVRRATRGSFLDSTPFKTMSAKSGLGTGATNQPHYRTQNVLRSELPRDADPDIATSKRKLDAFRYEVPQNLASEIQHPTVPREYPMQFKATPSNQQDLSTLGCDFDSDQLWSDPLLPVAPHEASSLNIDSCLPSVNHVTDSFDDSLFDDFLDFPSDVPFTEHVGQRGERIFDPSKQDGVSKTPYDEIEPNLSEMIQTDYDDADGNEEEINDNDLLDLDMLQFEKSDPKADGATYSPTLNGPKGRSRDLCSARNGSETEFDDLWLEDVENTTELCTLVDNTFARPPPRPVMDQVSASNPRKYSIKPPSLASISANPVTTFDEDQVDQSIEFRAIVRPPFPDAVQDRSPITGLSSSTLLRTCFRVGEAINCGCDAIRRGLNVVIELYARVASSYREVDGVVLDDGAGRGISRSGRQHFVFKDLFHDHPPTLEGFYELWQACDLWDHDSGVFLEHDGSGDGKLCRVVGRMTRARRKWRFVVLNIWEAQRADVEFVRGIVCA